MTNPTKILLIVLSVAIRFGHAQIYQPILFPEKVDKKYIFDPVKDQLKYEKKLGKKLSGKNLKDFTCNAVYTKTNLFTEGNVYLSWPEMESYINQILDSIMPSTLTSKKIRAFVGRSSDINAYCLYDGTMIVNVGLIAEVKNEAALAAIMGHELGHFIKNHLLSNFKNRLKNKNQSALNQDLKNNKHSQENELDADQQGFSIASSAGYDLEEASSNFELFIREEEYYKKRNASTLASYDSVTITTKNGKYNANTLEKLLRSHPDMKDRKEKLSTYIKTNKQSRKVKYKMDEDLFLTLQKQARLETVNLMFNAHNYNECLERSFIYHLFNPSDINYSYFTAECTRRLCLLDYKLKKKGFLTEKLSNEGFGGNKGILHDLHYLVPNSERYSKINAKQLLDSTRFAFETYKDAFYYFTERLLEKNYQEAYLMKALFENNKSKIDENINKYLAYDKARHKEFANHYAKNTLNKSISGNTNEIVMVPKVYFYSNDAWGNKYIYFNKSEIVGTELSNQIATLMNSEMQNTKVISLPFAATESFNTKYRYETILNSCLLARRDENEGYNVVHYYKNLEDEDYVGKLDLFRLDPNIWEFFRENKISTISYALYNRDKSGSQKVKRNIYLICGIFFPPFLPVGALIPINYKTLYLYSFNAGLGELYYESEIKSRKITDNKALKLFKSAKKVRDIYITEHTQKN